MTTKRPAPSAPQPKPTGISPAAVASAREAYVLGDFRAVLDTLAGVGPGSSTPIDALLLRARAMLRLHQRPQDVLDELAPILTTIVNVDERATAAMLHAAALARLDPSAGLAALLAAADAATRARVHPAVRAEIAYYRALTFWSVGNGDEAERLARIAERDGRDVLSVRATELRAFNAMKLPRAARYADALALFRKAAHAYDACRERDANLATNITQQIASLEQTLRSAEILGTHRVRHGKRALPGAMLKATASSMGYMQMCCDDAFLFALDGDGTTALARMLEAVQSAPTPAWRAWALAAGATIAAMIGNHESARLGAKIASDIARAVDWNATRDYERLALLYLSEAYAVIGDADAASSALATFDAIEEPLDAIMLLRDRDADPRMRGWYAHVRALVLRGEGDLAGAAKSLATAVASFRSCGYLWREANSLVEFDTIALPETSGEHIDRAVALVRKHFPKSFIARRIGPWMQSAIDPLIAGRLSPAEREIVLHLLKGRSQREIAAVTGRSYNTVRTQFRTLHRKFGTSSEVQLVLACVRRGIDAPPSSLTRAAG